MITAAELQMWTYRELGNWLLGYLEKTPNDPKITDRVHDDVKWQAYEEFELVLNEFVSRFIAQHRPARFCWTYGDVAKIKWMMSPRWEVSSPTEATLWVNPKA